MPQIREVLMMYMSSEPSRSSTRAVDYGLIATRKLTVIAGAGLVMLSILAGTVPANAQFKSAEQSVQTPYGRAPLTFADIVEKVKPAVVDIHVTSNGGKQLTLGGPRGGGGGLLPNLPKDHPLNKFFKKNFPKDFGGGKRRSRPTRAQGSGFFISADGYVVTNNHVIDGATKILVSLDGHEMLEAELIGSDARTDVALLKVKEKRKFSFVKFATKKVREGDWVVAIGNPFGLSKTVTVGVISAMGRDIGSSPYDFIQIDAAVNKGNSGGPTFNLDGEVIGVNTAIYSPSGGNVGIAFAVPAKTVSAVVNQLKSNGSVKRGWLGVKIQNIDDDTAASLGLKEAKGALVNEVTRNSPAAKYGLQARDAIIAVNGEKIDDSRDLARKIAEYSPSTRVKVAVLRDGQSKVITVKLGTFPISAKALAKLESAKPDTPAETRVPELGLTLESLTGKGADAESGVRVSDVDPTSNSSEKGLKAGDIITGAGRITVKTPKDVADAVAQAKAKGRNAVLLTIKAGGRQRLVGVRFSKKKG